jgi:hypothetical protein
MKLSMLVIAALLTFGAGTLTAANAVEFNVSPGGVYVGPDQYRGYGYGYGENCRVIIDHRTNRFGEDVTVRRRICD